MRHLHISVCVSSVAGVCFVGRLSHNAAGRLSLLLWLVGFARLCRIHLGLDVCVRGAAVHCPAGGALSSTCGTGEARNELSRVNQQLFIVIYPPLCR